MINLSNSSQLPPGIDVTPGLLRMAGIPKAFWNLTIEAYHAGCYAEGSSSYIENDKHTVYQKLFTIAKSDFVETGKSFYIYGRSNTGKTAYACILLQKTLAKGLRVFFCRTSEVIDFWANLPGKEESLQSIVKSVNLLCLDDLGSEQKNERTWTTLNRIVRTRKEENLSTIITTNLDLSGTQAYPAPFVTTLQKCCSALHLALNPFKVNP